MAKNPPDNAEEAIKEIRQLLADLLESTEKASKPVARIMRLLDVVDQELQREPVRGRGPSRGKDKRLHTVETTASGQFLTEGKPGDKSPPFRVPKSIYDLTAKVLADSAEPMKFEEILAKVTEKSAIPPGDFQIRVCLRFWLSADPPLIGRGKTKYHPIAKAAFAASVEQLWQATTPSRTTD